MGRHQQQAQHEYLFFEYPENGGQVAIRMGPWKGIRRNMRNNPQAPREIYNLVNGCSETTDVAAARPELMEQFPAIPTKEHQSAHVQE